MAYFLCNFQSFPLLWAALPKCRKSCNFHAFRTAGKHHFYDFIAPKPSFFRTLPRFPAEFEHVTTYKQMAHGLFSLQFSKFSFALGGSAKMPKKLQFPCFSHCRKASLLWSHCAQAQFLSCIAKVSCGIWAWHYIQTDGTWLIFSAIFKVVLCFGRLLPNCWKICSFHAFPTAAKHHFYDLIAPKPSFFRPLRRFPAEFEHDTTYKQMAHGLFSLQFSRFSFALGGFCHFHPFTGFLCNFLGFPLGGRLLPKMLKKL